MLQNAECMQGQELDTYEQTTTKFLLEICDIPLHACDKYVILVRFL